jgi:hypothetical protein
MLYLEQEDSWWYFTPKIKPAHNLKGKNWGGGGIYAVTAN